MYLNLRHEVTRPLLGYLVEAFETFTSRMNSVANVPVLPNDRLTAEKDAGTPTHDLNVGNTA